MKRVVAHLTEPQFIRYVLVGMWNTACGYGLYAAFTYLLTPRVPFAYMVASALSAVINLSMAYACYKVFVFRTRSNYLREYVRYGMVSWGIAIVNLALLPFAVGLAERVAGKPGAAPYIGGAALTGVSVIASYLGNTYYSFRATSEGDSCTKML